MPSDDRGSRVAAASPIASQSTSPNRSSRPPAAALPREAGAASAGIEHDPCGYLPAVGKTQPEAATRERRGRAHRRAHHKLRSGRTRGFAQQRIKAAAVEMPAMAEITVDEV